MQTVKLPGGESVPALGQGMWHMGSDRNRRSEEIATIRLGLDLGLTLIDTAEIYGDGRSEKLVAEAIAGRREEVFLVSKVAPRHAKRADTVAACERSLARLKTDRIDLYLLHWRSGTPIADTIAAFLDLQESGKIRHFGVSNFHLDDMEELWAVDGGSSVAANQLHYNLAHRGIEAGVLSWLRERGVPVMAYSPIGEGKLADNRRLAEFARANDMTPTQVALAWLLASDDMIVIPKTGRRERMRENAGALDHPLSKAQLAELDRLFPPPTSA
ncbi:MAG: aldo/keto reductase [Gammaproteobacteria bacterium]